MTTRHALTLAVLLPLAACGGGGGTGAASPQSSAQVTIDTAAGVDATIATQVVAVTLEGSDGTMTGNLLAQPTMVTLADPAGAPAGIALDAVPHGTFARMHLVTAPGSTTATARDGGRAQVDLPAVDLRVEFETGLHHQGGHRWLAVRHGGAAALTGSGGRRGWNPNLVGGDAAGGALPALCLTITAIAGQAVFGSIGGDDRQRVHLEFEAGAELLDDQGGRRTPAEFLAGLQIGDEICVSGAVDTQGVLRGRRGSHHGRTDNPRYLGRIVELDAPNTSVAMDVQALTRRGARQELPAPERVTVRAAGAYIHHGGSFQRLTFAELAVGDLVKVTWSVREGSVVRAREIEVTSRNGQPANPEIQGLVGEVDLANGRIVVVPRGNDPLILSGRVLTRLEARVLPNTVLVRQTSAGGGRTAITLGDVVAGQDRIWIRGTATGEASIDADLVRVRTD